MVHPKGSPPSSVSDLTDFGFHLPDNEWLARLRATRPTAAPGRIGMFDLIAEVGRGAQGVVFRARQPHTGRTIAIKRLAAGAFASGSMRARFQRELETASALQHPNIVTIYGLEVVDGQPLIAMEWVDGRPVDRYVAESIAADAAGRAVLRLFLKICGAVQHAHQRGVLHRDLKPSNILIDAAGEPRILDFGLAKRLDEAGDQGLTRTDGLVGTPAYASPEQLSGEHHAVGVCSDVYSLGVILYQLLTGRLPFDDGRGFAVLLDAIRCQPPPPPSRFRPALDADVDAMALTALEKAPAGRYQSVHAFAADIERYLGGQPILARADRRWYVLSRTVRRYRFAAALAAAAVALIGLAAAALSVLYARQGQILADEMRARHNAERSQECFQNLLLSVADLGRSSELSLRRAVLADATRDAEEQLADQPRAQATAFETIARADHQLGLYAESERLMRRALSIYDGLVGRESVESAAALDHLGRVLRSMNRFAEAEAPLHEALRIRRLLLGDDHVDVAASLASVGLSLQDRHDYDAAEPLHRQAVDILRRLRGNGHPDLAAALLEWANVQMNKRAYAEAEQACREALAIQRQAAGKPTPAVAVAQVNLAKALSFQGRSAEAEPLFVEAIATFRSTLGDQHDNVGWALHRYGTSLHALGRLAEAEPALEEALSIYRRCFDPTDLYVTTVLDSLATLYRDSGRHADAQRLSNEVATRRATVSPVRP